MNSNLSRPSCLDARRISGRSIFFTSVIRSRPFFFSGRRKKLRSPFRFSDGIGGGSSALSASGFLSLAFLPGRDLIFIISSSPSSDPHSSELSDPKLSVHDLSPSRSYNPSRRLRSGSFFCSGGFPAGFTAGEGSTCGGVSRSPAAMRRRPEG